MQMSVIVAFTGAMGDACVVRLLKSLDTTFQLLMTKCA